MQRSFRLGGLFFLVFLWSLCASANGSERGFRLITQYFAGDFGGEEFALILPGTELQGAVHFAESLRTGLEALALPHPTSPFRIVTGTFGAASFVPSDLSSTDDLVQAADQALYVAKAEGRNRVHPGRSAPDETCTKPST